ncbi:MAG: helicase-exonuclease AddAB subunit AddB [Lachnoclostridium sp.]|nr:helicase-exonuclease AddAB subunit AddB [Lachnospira sp.]MCM1247401.1 helicase-exonuclease AddAB subunit AddB [Lachnoclostridium sp.]MCM1536178.1 helicase-exonuclease AddAB subunit AddB [Clostridium sp.]
MEVLFGMSLRFYFGPSGVGKSRQLYEEIIRRAKEDKKQNFLIVVPDQFTMQTQKDLVTLSDLGGIMNIDVLSFGRLNHRIMEEVGKREIPVLDDTGKSLVLQKVAAGLKEELPALGGFLHKQGYIHEVKSAISEFMQYGISTEDVDKLIQFAEKKGALVQKLKDLKILYQGFLEYIQGNFITTEETLDVLRRSLEKSKLIRGSVVVFDGFTGFTPIQNRLIQELMRLSAETIVTVTLGAGENPYESDGEQKLFHLSKKTVTDLVKLAKEANVPKEKDVFILPDNNPHHRFADAPALHALEKGIFRYSYESFAEEQEEIVLFETLTPRDEVHQAGLAIRKLIAKQGMAYRDIAVIMGDLEGYAPYVESEFEQLQIPCFIDRTRGIILNPMIEYIKSALELFRQDFSYEAVFHYLRSGLADIDRQDVDMLENYVIRTGIRGKRRWSRLFTAKTPEMKEDDEEPLQRLNALRERFMIQVEALQRANCQKSAPAKEYVNELYEFLVQNQVQQKLADYEKQFHGMGELSREREYAQIYRLVLELLEQIYALLGEELISLQEFQDILEAGFGEIEVGTIPQNVDRILVGDMERTRLRQVKALFFLGINDGNIPKSAQKGGIISDMDREFLQESEFTLAPTPRQQMYIQRFYLYLNMTKPSERLYLSYARMNSKGKSIRPAYLIEEVKKLFPALTVQYPQNRSILEQIVTPGEGMRYLAAQFREYAAGTLQKEEEQTFFTLYQVYGGEEQKGNRRLLEEAAFQRYRDLALSGVAARALYGKNLQNSVTRLETYAACAYRHFLQYGLTLRERQEFGFEAVDMGNLYHGVLESFAEKLSEKGYTWFDFPEAFGEEAVGDALEAYAAAYGETVLYSSARNEYAITRMKRILSRTVLTLQEQLKKGVFLPDAYEVSFRFAQDLESIQVTLSEEEKMHLRGRIDRIDVAEDDRHVYVKVIDYKSGNRQFNLAALYYGLQLQLVVYMNAAMEIEAKKHPDKEIVPAALLYYHVDDPVIETPVELTDEEISEQILGKLRMNGVVNGEPDIVKRLDQYMDNKSDVIPVEKKKDGSFTARSGIMSREELGVLSDYVNYKMRCIGREILDGKISINPYEKGSENACAYCEYKKVCGYDGAIPGYEKRTLQEWDKEELMKRMHTDCGGSADGEMHTDKAE